MDAETTQTDSKKIDIILPVAAVPATYADVHAAVAQAVGSNPSERALRGSVLRVLAEQTALTVPDVLELQVVMPSVGTEGSVDDRIASTITNAFEAIEGW